MQYRINRFRFSSFTEKKNKHKNPLKVQMKLLGKGWLEKPQHEAMYTVCGCIVQYMKFLLKQHAVFVLHITETLYTGPCCCSDCPARVFILFQHMYTANSISQRHYVHLL